MRRLPALLVLLFLVAPLAAGDGTEGFLPKDDLGVAAFRTGRPDADGRGITVAVLDTGVDLLHPSLQKTPAGERKIIDFFDGTDAGLVETGVDAKIAAGTVLGLTGRRLTVPDGLPAEVRLGVLRASVIYPRGLLHRLRTERKKERARAKILSEAMVGHAGRPKVPPDPGDPIHDLILTKVADEWRLLLDTDMDGDLTDEKNLREFATAGDVAVIGGAARLGLGFRVLRDGAAVSLLFDGGGHGTHVAGIIAGYHGEGSPLNGLAPGAKILAAKIGNGRFGGATTHLALIQGLEWAGRKGAEVVNISFGGPTLFGDGREISARFIDEAIRKYGFAVCTSAGNSGPALTTVGSPATSRRAFSIGAWCSKATQVTNYGVIDPRAGTLFGFSSRGPLPGGAAGVDFIAPGAAVSAVPEWQLESGRNMNGTSMAAPQASGAVAVLLSAARAEGVPVTWRRLSDALRRGAKTAPGVSPVEQGYGLIDTVATYRILEETAAEPEPVEWIAGGFYERTSVRDEPIRIRLSLRPDFGKDADPKRKTRFGRTLRIEPDRPWLRAASPVHVSSKGVSVSAVADPKGMEPGLNSALLRAVDVATGREVARLPVTVIRPRDPGRGSRFLWETKRLEPGEKHSLFILVPPKATLARVEARETDPEGGTRIALRTADFHTEEKGSPLDTEPADQGKTTTLHRAVRPGTTLEIAVSRPFRARGASLLEVGVAFKGLDPKTPEVVIPRGRLGTHLDLVPAGKVAGRFDARVEWTEEPLALTWKSARALDAPLLLGEEPIYLHEGTGAFRVPPDRREVRFDLRFETPFEDYLDDAAYLIEDRHGKVVARGHIWRGPFSFRPPHRGRFTLRVRVWERGKRFFRGGAIFSPLLLRKIPGRGLTVRHGIREGFLPGVPSGRHFNLPEGSRSAALVERPKGDEALRGTIRFTDSDWGTALFTRRLRVEPAVKPLATVFVSQLEEKIEAALDSDEVPAGTLGQIETMAATARAAGVAKPRHEAGLLLLRARSGAARDAFVALLKMKGKDRLLLAARAEAALLTGEVAKAETLAKQRGGDDEFALRLGFLLAMKRGDQKEALKQVERFVKKAPPRPSMQRARFSLLVARKRVDEARRLLAEWTGRFPSRKAEVAAMASEIEKAEKVEKAKKPEGGK